jgi:restriction system protein
MIGISSKLPWWLGGVLAVAAYVGLHSVAASDAMAVAQPGKMGAFAGLTLARTLATWGQYLLPFVFLAAAGLSAYGRFTRRALHAPGAASPDWGALNAMSGRQFEALVGEAFLRKGYAVTGTGGGSTGGGVDLVLKMKGETFLVQCKQWRALKVGVNAVRELHGVMEAKGAAGGFVVTSGVFTEEALAFARGKPVELMDGKALHALIRGVSVPARILRDPLSVMTSGAPFCPECQSRMVKRKVRRGADAGKVFWSCARYPDCRGSREV